jgi:hypothetical protein
MANVNRKCLGDYPNPYDDDAVDDAGSAQSTRERRIAESEAAGLRLAGRRATASGSPALGILYDNAAWQSERGMDWLEMMRVEMAMRDDGMTDDVEVRE